MINLMISSSVFSSHLEEMKKGWPQHLHVLADFDKTLTKAQVGEKGRGSLISVLYHEGYLSEEYQTTAQEWYNYYSKIERDTTLPVEQRKAAMQEWWTKHKKLLIEEWLTKEHIYQAMQSENLQLRDGYQEFFNILSTSSIPLIILSAGGLGTLSIQKYLELHQVFYPNIYLIGNDFIRDESWKAIDFKLPIIHSLNKSETVLKDFPIYAEIQERKNVLLLWDTLNDVDMITWFEYDTCLKVWFLNKDIDANLPQFQQAYDVVITNDGSLDEVNRILKEILLPS